MKSCKKIMFPILIALVATLSSCNFLDIFLNSNNQDEYSYPEEESENISSNAGYYRAGYSDITYYDVGKKSLYGAHTLNTLGTQKILVVPVIIEGFESLATEKVRQEIEASFFGDSTETGWESVSSYFYKSSYGNLNITGDVTNWFNPNLTPNEIHKLQYNDLDDGGTIELVSLARDFAISQGYNMKDYDLNSDGYIDSICLIYGAPNYSNYSYSLAVRDTMWAFTYWDYKNVNSPSTNNPVPNTYMWASYDFMYEGSSVGIKIDAHTYIHEMGHVLGLDDYYDYDGLHSPMGCIDMQDCNVGDHNAFSKYALGWSRPYVVTDNCTITIKSSATSTHSILVKNPANPWNNSAFDEYLLLELVTPENLWKQDSTYKYPSLGAYAYQSPGVRIMHVDARLMDHNEKIVNKLGNGLYTTAYSNTPSFSYSKGTITLRQDLLALIPANKNLDFQRKPIKIANDNNLFKTGQVFTTEAYLDFFYNNKLHNGENIPFKITFVDVNKESATIKFERI